MLQEDHDALSVAVCVRNLAVGSFAQFTSGVQGQRDRAERGEIEILRTLPASALPDMLERAVNAVGRKARRQALKVPPGASEEKRDMKRFRAVTRQICYRRPSSEPRRTGEVALPTPCYDSQR